MNTLPVTEIFVDLHSGSDYTALRKVGARCKTLAEVILVLVGIGAVASLLMSVLISFVVDEPRVLILTIPMGISLAVGFVGIGIISSTLLRAYAESILVILDIEENTRRAAVTLEQRLEVL